MWDCCSGLLSNRDSLSFHSKAISVDLAQPPASNTHLTADDPEKCSNTVVFILRSSLDLSDVGKKTSK